MPGPGQIQVDQGRYQGRVTPYKVPLQFGQIVFYFNLLYYCVFVGVVSQFMVQNVRPHNPHQLASQAELQDNSPKYWSEILFTTLDNTYSETVLRLLRNNSYNFSVYSECSFVQENLHLKKENWQTVAEVVIMVVSASRLLIEIFKLFQEC